MALPANIKTPTYVSSADGTSAPLDPLEGGLSLASVYLQQGGSADDAVALSRNASNQLLFKDGDQTRKLSELVANKTTSGGSLSIGGEFNTLNAPYYGAVVVGGQSNTASADYAAVFGGNQCVATGNKSVTVGGQQLGATADHAGVFGGQSNGATAAHSAVVGGEGNQTEGAHSIVVGGKLSVAQGPYSAVVGGLQNATHPLASNSVVVGGTSNIITATAPGNSFHSVIAGGAESQISNSTWSFIGGGRYSSVSGASYSAVLAGEYNQVGAANSVALGGYGGQTNSERSALLGGQANRVNGAPNGVVAGGTDNWAEADSAGVFAGASNRAQGVSSAALGGAGNYLVGFKSASVGGSSNVAGGANAATIGGDGNTAFGLHSVALGGTGNLADGRSSVTIGEQATARTVRGALAHASGGSAQGSQQTRTMTVWGYLDANTPNPILGQPSVRLTAVGAKTTAEAIDFTTILLIPAGSICLVTVAYIGCDAEASSSNVRYQYGELRFVVFRPTSAAPTIGPGTASQGRVAPGVELVDFLWGGDNYASSPAPGLVAVGDGVTLDTQGLFNTGNAQHRPTYHSARITCVEIGNLT